MVKMVSRKVHSDAYPSSAVICRQSYIFRVQMPEECG